MQTNAHNPQLAISWMLDDILEGFAHELYVLRSQEIDVALSIRNYGFRGNMGKPYCPTCMRQHQASLLSFEHMTAFKHGPSLSVHS